jgi:hypothetical protein
MLDYVDPVFPRSGQTLAASARSSPTPSNSPRRSRTSSRAQESVQDPEEDPREQGQALSYSQDCKVVPREVCDQVKSVVLVLECSLILPSAGGAAAVHLRAGEELPDPRVNK